MNTTDLTQQAAAKLATLPANHIGATVTVQTKAGAVRAMAERGFDASHVKFLRFSFKLDGRVISRAKLEALLAD